MTSCDMGNCPHEAEIRLLTRRDEELMEAIKRIEQKVDEVAKGVSSIQGLEIKHTYHEEAMTRAFTEIAALKSKLDATETKLNALVSKGDGAAMAVKVMWTLGGAIVALALMQAKYILFALSGGH